MDYSIDKFLEIIDIQDIQDILSLTNNLCENMICGKYKIEVIFGDVIVANFQKGFLNEQCNVYYYSLSLHNNRNLCEVRMRPSPVPCCCHP